LEDLAQQCDLLKQRLLIITDSKLTAEQMMHETEKQLQQEEVYKSELMRILAALRKEHYEITNSLKTESMERRIAPLQGEVNEEQIAALKEQIKTKTKELEMQTEIQKTLSNQLIQAQTDVLYCQRSIASLKNEYDAVEYRMSTDELYVDQTQKALKLAEKEKNNLLVEENMLRLQLTRLTRMLDNHNEQVFDLEKQRLQLKVFATERKLDLQMYMDNLRAELNINAEEKTRLSIELQAKKMQVCKTRNRFEIASVKLAPPEGEEAHSQAYYIIKASQQRSALKARGDQLDREIAQGVKEVEALENTLSVMNGCNRTYRQSQMEVPEDSELATMKHELEEALKLSLLTGAMKRRQNTEIESKCNEYLESNRALDKELANINNAEKLLTEKLELQEKELKSLDERLARAERCMKKAKATAREAIKLETDAWKQFSDDIKVCPFFQFYRLIQTKLKVFP
uniref:Coiled-coil domain-containing protein 39 n=1 Tax=Schistocephalus solidus TaxID=70667 RepID=A0A183TLI8_SCHSO